MPNVLLIDLAREDVAALHGALGSAGHRVTAVGTGLFALTMVERDRPDIIVSRTRVSDIDGYELCSIIRSDPATHGVPFLLLAGPDGGDADAAQRVGATRMLPGDASVETIVNEVGTLLGRETEAAVIVDPAGIERRAPPRAAMTFGSDGPGAAAAPGEAGPVVGDRLADQGAAARPAANGDRPGIIAGRRAGPGPGAGPTFQGSLDVMDITDLTQAMGNGGKTGHLSVRLSGGEGAVVFEGGRVVHAEYEGRFGEEAFAALVVAAQRASGGEFCFTPLERYSAIAPRTIDRSVEQLLLSIAAEIDEGRTDAAAIAPTA